jgi:hypothetical protein
LQRGYNIVPKMQDSEPEESFSFKGEGGDRMSLSFEPARRRVTSTDHPMLSGGDWNMVASGIAERAKRWRPLCIIRCALGLKD